jgi:hypothetical protein
LRKASSRRCALSSKAPGSPVSIFKTLASCTKLLKYGLGFSR